MKIRGIYNRVFRVENELTISDGKIFCKEDERFRNTTNPIKDKFKLYIKRKQHKLSKK